MICEKKRFPTKKEAKLFARNTHRKYGLDKATPHKCPGCGGYHLTTVDWKGLVRIRENLSSFKIGQIWIAKCGDNEARVEIVKGPVSAVGLHQFLNAMRLVNKDES